MINFPINYKVFITTLFAVFLLLTPNITSAAIFNISSDDIAGLISSINIANSTAEADVINLDEGVFNLLEPDNYLNGLPIITTEITIRGAGMDKTTIQRGLGLVEPRFRILEVSSSGKLTLESLALRGGFTKFEVEFGGGIFNRGTLTIANSKISNNTAARGGGINNQGKLSIEDGTISNNTALRGISGEGGGGIRTDFASGVININRTKIINNFAPSGSGIFIDGEPTGSVTNSVFLDNVLTLGTHGGAIVTATKGIFVTFNNNCIVGNSDFAVFNGSPLANIDATNNWWGASNGPGGVGGGSGDEVAPGVTFTPFLTAPILNNCTLEPELIRILIDIKPGSDPNSINPKSHGKTPVAILSTTDFNAVQEVDVASLTFGRAGEEKSLSFCNKSAEDTNNDGLLDLICHFKTRLTSFAKGDSEGILKGTTISGTRIEGRDSVKIVPNFSLFESIFAWFNNLMARISWEK